MTEIEYSHASDAASLCKACGLCCTGHLFSWARIKPGERARLQKLGMTIVQPGLRQYGFIQPCPQWNGQCAIYDSPAYPSGCSSYNCKLLRELLDERIPLPRALSVVRRAKDKMRAVDELLPSSALHGFRDRLMGRLEELNKCMAREAGNVEFRSKAHNLFEYLEKRFGLHDFPSAPEAR